MEIKFLGRCKKSKQNSAKIIHQNTALKSTFSILLCNNSDRTCFSVHKHLLGSSGDVENFGTQRMLMHGKTCFIPILQTHQWLFYTGA